MGTSDVALMAMILASALGYLLAEGELRRVRWVQAMRRCLQRMTGIIRYEQPALSQLLERIDLNSTPQERELTRLLHVCAGKLAAQDSPQLLTVFARESAGMSAFGALSSEDRSAFEAVLSELGSLRLTEQLRLMDSAEERLCMREQELSKDGMRRAKLIRTLGFSGGAALFLILI